MKKKPNSTQKRIHNIVDKLADAIIFLQGEKEYFQKKLAKKKP